jgi:CRP/FNR family cyclic AMP-dependent transcriptional regulator
MEKIDLEKRASFLRGVIPFQLLSPDELERLSAGFKTRVYKNRDFIIRQDDTSTDLFVIKSGKVRVLTLNSYGDESCLRVFSVGDIFGEFSACDGSPRSASAQALGQSTILVMSRRHFLTYLETMPKLAMSFIQFLLDKLRWTTLYSHTIAQYDTAGRLLHMLIHYKDIMGKEIIRDKTYEIDLCLNQADLASMVGARREWVNRLLQKWRKEGLLVYNRGKITILDLPGAIKERDQRMSVLQEEPW